MPTKRKLFFLIFMILISPIYVSAYDINFVMQDDGSIDHIVLPPSVFWDSNCNVSITLFADASHTGSYTLNNKWFSPNVTQILFGNPSYSSNIVCLNQGTGTSTTSLSDFYESRTTTQTSATTTATWINVTYGCEFDNNLIFTYDNTNISDSFGHFPFAYGKTFDTWCGIAPTSSTWVVGDTINYLEMGYYSSCGADLDVDAAGAATTCSGGGVAYDYGMIYVTMTPFNSMSSGIVNISINRQEIITTGDASCIGGTLASAVYIWDIVTNSTTLLSATIPYSANLNLIPDRDYWLFIKGQRHDQRAGGETCTVTYHYTDYNMTVFAYEPDYVCDDWSNCTQGTQFRTCIDSNGVAPNKVETRSCIDAVPFFENLLGFEQFTNANVYTCQKFWFITCNDFLNVTTARFPVNWTVSGDIDALGFTRQNYLTVSPDTATEGSRSLKMWYIPPKPEEPVSDPANASLTICGNKSIGDFPETTTGFNETLFLSTNITFPAPFIDLRFDVRKCNIPVIQYDYTGDLLGLNCGKRCYAFDCNQTPNGRYGLRLTDIDTAEIIVDYTGLATTDWRSYLIDLSDSGLQTDHNYTLSLAVNPENQFDAFTHCLYFDNVKAALRTAAVRECRTICDDLNLLLAIQQGNSCVFTIITNAPECAPDQTTAEAFRDFNTVCIGTTLHFFNNETGIWDQTINSGICIEEISEAINESKITEPLGTAETWVDWILFLVSPLFIYFFISIAISGAVGRLTEKWEPFGVTFAFLIFVGMLITLPGSTVTIIPLWVGVAMIAVISLLMASTLRNQGFGSGGG